MLSSATELASPEGWVKIAEAGEVFGWGSPGGLPRKMEVGTIRRCRPLLRLEARSGAVLETTPEHDLWIESQMTGSQIIRHGDIAERMLNSSSYKRKSIYSFPEAVPVSKPESRMPIGYRDAAAKGLAAALPYLCAVGPFSLSIQMPRGRETFMGRRVLVELFKRLGMAVRMKGRCDAPFLAVELRGDGLACPDIMLARYAHEEMVELFGMLFELGFGAGLSAAQRGWWQMQSAYLGVRARARGSGLEVLRHRRHSLRCPMEGEGGRKACFEVETEGLPLILTRVRGSSPVLVPVR